MDIEDHQNAIRAAVIAAQLLAQHPIANLIEAAHRALDVGWIGDPTLWRDKHKALEEDLEILEAALPLVRLHRKITERAIHGG